jgi:NADPH:quinone reductase-like Zn-dependent oxidoreductase
MRAATISEFGGPEVIEYREVPTPAPGQGEVLVRVHAAGVNPPDWYMREGMPGLPREMLGDVAFPLILGTDVSGVIGALGPGVTGFDVGDEVFGMLRFPVAMQAGAYAEYVTAPISDIAHKPAGVSHREAAASAMSALTAWQFLIDPGHHLGSPLQDEPHHPVPLDSDSRVLVNGAAGGVGHLALQLAKFKGAEVTAVASGSHEEFLRGLGADAFIDYTTTDPTEVARGLDLVMDMVGGPRSASFVPTLKQGGALFWAYLAEFDDDELRKYGVRTSATQVRANGEQLARIAELLDNGTLHVQVDSVFPLHEARLAHERAAQGHLRGKIVLDVE